jgi:hypothetical protein
MPGESLRVQKNETLFRLSDFVPTLQQKFEERPFDTTEVLKAAVQARESGPEGLVVPELRDRRLLSITDGKEHWDWEVESLTSLFRGDVQPPVLGDEPKLYNDSFLVLELHVVEVSQIIGDRRDAELREIYSMLRRRPDGRSLGFVHDYLWQAAALLLGTRPLSQAEFEAILARLERSCRTFEQGPTSRNYVGELKSMIGQQHPTE